MQHQELTDRARYLADCAARVQRDPAHPDAVRSLAATVQQTIELFYQQTTGMTIQQGLQVPAVREAIR